MDTTIIQRVVKAIQSDLVLKELYANLYRIKLSAMPKWIISDGVAYMDYSDNFKQLDKAIRKEIKHREEQIINHYKP